MVLGLFEAITKLLPYPALLCTAAGRILAVNLAATRLNADLRAGTDLFDLVAEDSQELHRDLGHWLRSGDPLPGALTLKDAGGELVRFRCHGARATWWQGPNPAIQVYMTRLDRTDQFVVLSEQVALLNREVAFRRAAEAERERLLIAEQAGRVRLQRLYSLTAILASAATLTEVLQAVQDTAPAALNAHSVVLKLHSQRLVPALGPTDSLRALAGQTWIDLDQPAAHVPAPGRCAAGEDASATALIEVPLEAADVTLGRLSIDFGSVAPADPEHITAITQQIAQALRRAGLHEHEHRLAERLQRSLLPALPPVAEIDIASRYAPGTDMVDVGGDWYDVHVLDKDHVGFTIGDVAGHGLAEATAMGQISTALRGIALRQGKSPGAVLGALGNFLDAYHPHLMATACYLVFDRRTRTLRYSKAGHPPPLLISADGTSRFLDRALGPPLGMIPEFQYHEAEITVGDGDTLLLYTDGLIERREEPFDVGLARLADLARDVTGFAVEDLCELFLHHRPTGEMPDDRALLAARFPAPAVLPAATAPPSPALQSREASSGV
jgi:hypothetical protein